MDAQFNNAASWGLPYEQVHRFDSDHPVIRYGRTTVRTTVPGQKSYICLRCGNTSGNGIYYSACYKCRGISNDPHAMRCDFYCYDCSQGMPLCKCERERISPTLNILNAVTDSVDSSALFPSDQCCCCHAPCCTCTYFCNCRWCCLVCQCFSYICAKCCSCRCVKPERGTPVKSKTTAHRKR